MEPNLKFTITDTTKFEEGTDDLGVIKGTDKGIDNIFFRIGYFKVTFRGNQDLIRQIARSNHISMNKARKQFAKMYRNIWHSIVDLYRPNRNNRIYTKDTIMRAIEDFKGGLNNETS